MGPLLAILAITAVVLAILLHVRRYERSRVHRPPRLTPGVGCSNGPGSRV